MKNLKTILNCIGVAIIAILIVNLVAFGFEVAQTNMSGDWSFQFKHGVFSVGDKPTGLIFGSALANGFMILIFVSALFRNYKKGNLSLDQAS